MREPKCRQTFKNREKMCCLNAESRQMNYKPINVVLMIQKICMMTLLLAAVVVLTTSCDKKKGCYDEALYREHKDDFCTMDCPGVVGCDGETYCNECIARTKGIRVK